MVERRCRLRFSDEAAACVFVPHQLGREELQRHRPIQSRIDGFVDHSHAAAAEMLAYAVVRDRTAVHAGLPDRLISDGVVNSSINPAVRHGTDADRLPSHGYTSSTVKARTTCRIASTNTI